MGFVNEYIPEEDKKKHNITEHSNFYLAGTTSWTVDRQRNMFLIHRAGGGAEGYPVHQWAFCWRGELLDVGLELLEAGGDHRGGHGWARMRLVSIKGINPELAPYHEQIIADLREALIAHKGLGVHSRRTSYDVTLEV